MFQLKPAQALGCLLGRARSLFTDVFSNSQAILDLDIEAVIC